MDEPPIRVVFMLAAAPDNQSLNLMEEYNIIDGKLRSTGSRDRFDLIQRYTMSVDGLREILLRYNPSIIHFYGYGRAIMFQTVDGGINEASTTDLMYLFKLLGKDVHCVVLDSCYSQSQAEVIATEIDCVIGIPSSITRTATREFATSFYESLGYGRSIGDAFKLSDNKLELFRISDRPKLLTRAKINPFEIFLLGSGISINASQSISPMVYKTPDMYESLEKAYSELRKGKIGLREFWQVDGKGNLYNALSFLLTHADDYHLGKDDFELIEGLLNTTPVMLSDLEKTESGIDNAYENRDALTDKIMRRYSQAMYLIGKLTKVIS